MTNLYFHISKHKSLAEKKTLNVITNSIVSFSALISNFSNPRNLYHPILALLVNRVR